MRHIICLGLLLVATRAFAQNAAPKANTLSPKEIAEGWLLLFDGDSDFGWNGDGIVKSGDGKLTITSAGTKGASARPSGRLRDFELQFDYSVPGTSLGAHLTLLRDRQTKPPAIALLEPTKESAWWKAQVTVEAGQLSALWSFRQ